MTDPSPSTEDLARAALALAVAPPAEGKPPTLLEIEQWRHGRVTEGRAAQIRSHLARDPALFALLAELETADAHLALLAARTAAERLPAPGAARVPRIPASPALATRPRSTALTRWRELWRTPATRWLGGGLATALAMALIAVALVPLLRPLEDSGLQSTTRSAGWEEPGRPDILDAIDLGFARRDPPADFRPTGWPWREGGGATAADRARLAWRAGVRQGLQRWAESDPAWAGVLAQLPAQPPTCPPGDSGCARVVELYAAAGRWGVLVYWQCRRTGVDEGFWAEQGLVREYLGLALAAVGERSELARRLDAWPPGNSPRARLCGGIDGWLEQGLRGKP